MVKIRIWRIVPGEAKSYRSTILGKFLREEYIAVGINEAGDLTDLSEDEIRKKFGAEFLVTIRHKIKKGDIVVLSGDGFIWAIGIVKGDYRYDNKDPNPEEDDILSEHYWSFYHRRDVEWRRVMKMPFRILPENVRNKLGLPPAIVELTGDEWLDLASTLNLFPPAVF